ncbi:MAG: hypothetical protein IJV44_12830 [Prevotella sp.]|nr:hypothetical protein [Prevotella sp.]
MRKIVLFALGLVAGATAYAQDEVETTIGADFVSQYVWRGQDCGNVSIQPTLGIGYKGLSLSAWGSVGINAEDTKEFDLTASYTIGGLTLGVTDYWFNTPEERYFYYNAHGTSHVFEAFLGYDFGLLSATWYTNFAGNDGVNKKGKRAYSSYFELNAPFKLATCDWTATVGVVPYATTSYDTTGFAVTNVALKATKDIRITDTFSVPIFGQVLANPCSQKAYFVFGFTLQP